MRDETKKNMILAMCKRRTMPMYVFWNKRSRVHGVYMVFIETLSVIRLVISVFRPIMLHIEMIARTKKNLCQVLND